MKRRNQPDTMIYLKKQDYRFYQKDPTNTKYRIFKKVKFFHYIGNAMQVISPHLIAEASSHQPQDRTTESCVMSKLTMKGFWSQRQWIGPNPHDIFKFLEYFGLGAILSGLCTLTGGSKIIKHKP